MVRNRILIFLLLAAIPPSRSFLSERTAACRENFNAVMPVRENIVASLAQQRQGRADLAIRDARAARHFCRENLRRRRPNVKKGQRLLDLNVKDADAQLAEARCEVAERRRSICACERRRRIRSRPRRRWRAGHRYRATRSFATHSRCILHVSSTSTPRRKTNSPPTMSTCESSGRSHALSAVKQQFDRSVTLDTSSAPLSPCSRRKAKSPRSKKKFATAALSAPADGTLYSLPVKTGDFVQLGDLLAEMADLSKVRVRAFIDEPELGALAPTSRFASRGMRCPIASGTAKPKRCRSKSSLVARAASANCSVPSITTSSSCYPT